MDEDFFFGLLGLIAIGVIFAPFILSLVAMSRTGDMRRKLASLEARLAQLDQTAGAVPGVETQEAAPAAEPVVVTPTAPEPIVSEPIIPAEPAREEAAEEIAAPPPREPPRRAGIEEKLTSRCLVWLGAVALVLAGV